MEQHILNNLGLVLVYICFQALLTRKFHWLDTRLTANEEGLFIVTSVVIGTIYNELIPFLLGLTKDETRQTMIKTQGPFVQCIGGVVMVYYFRVWDLVWNYFFPQRMIRRQE